MLVDERGGRSAVVCKRVKQVCDGVMLLTSASRIDDVVGQGCQLDVAVRSNGRADGGV